jgi:hypothetical protein
MRIPESSVGHSRHGVAELKPAGALIGVAAFVAFQIIMVPSYMPVILFALYSYWVPQIWRNAARQCLGVDRLFILGTTIGRLALPLCGFCDGGKSILMVVDALGCPDNVFYSESVSWVWGLALWQLVQVLVLLAQHRLGPTFL